MLDLCLNYNPNTREDRITLSKHTERVVLCGCFFSGIVVILLIKTHFERLPCIYFDYEVHMIKDQIWLNRYGVFHPLGEGDGTLLQYSCLENPTDRGAWQAAVHGVAKSRTRLSDFTFTLHFHALEKEMATRSSVLAWRVPGTGEPGGLPSMGSHRVRHDWSDLAAAAVHINNQEKYYHSNWL